MKFGVVREKTQDGYIQTSEGVWRKTLVYGDRTLLAEFFLETGTDLPRHSHPYEQTGYLVSGRMIMSIADKQYELEPGASWCIPENVEHQVTVLEGAVVVEVFSPVREEYIP